MNKQEKAKLTKTTKKVKIKPINKIHNTYKD